MFSTEVKASFKTATIGTRVPPRVRITITCRLGTFSVWVVLIQLVARARPRPICITCLNMLSTKMLRARSGRVKQQRAAVKVDKLNDSKSLMRHSLAGLGGGAVCRGQWALTGN